MGLNRKKIHINIDVMRYTPSCFYKYISICLFVFCSSHSFHKKSFARKSMNFIGVSFLFVLFSSSFILWHVYFRFYKWCPSDSGNRYEMKTKNFFISLKLRTWWYVASDVSFYLKIKINENIFPFSGIKMSPSHIFVMQWWLEFSSRIDSISISSHKVVHIFNCFY